MIHWASVSLPLAPFIKFVFLKYGFLEEKIHDIQFMI